MNTTGRALWIMWCCAWAGTWTVLATLSDGSPEKSRIFFWIMAAGSAAAIALPVCKTKMQVPPPDSPFWRTPQQKGDE